MNMIQNRWVAHSRGVRLSGLGLATLIVTNCAPAVSEGSRKETSVKDASASAAIMEASLVLEGVTVVDVERGTRMPDQRVAISGNRIQAIGSADRLRVSPTAQVVNARGKYLIPGLWDMHTHQDRFPDRFFPLLLANGVTGIRNAGSQVPLDSLKRLRQEVLAGTRIGPPRQILSASSIDGPEWGCKRQPTVHVCVTDTADALHLVDSMKAAGADMLKMYSLTTPMYYAIAAEARRIGIPFGGHVQSLGLTATDASDSGARIIDHMKPAGGLQKLCWGNDDSILDHCLPAAERLARNGTWLVPTLTVIANVEGARGRSAPVVARLGELTREFWDGLLPRGNWLRDAAADGMGNLTDSLGGMYVMQRVGMPVLAGTDTGPQDALKWMAPGFGLHAELAMYVAEGLTPLNALQSATLNPAKMLDATDSLGVVAPGKLADLVLLDADPLADITNTTMIQAVVANGRYFDRAALDGLLADGRAKGNGQP